MKQKSNQRIQKGKISEKRLLWEMWQNIHDLPYKQFCDLYEQITGLHIEPWQILPVANWRDVEQGIKKALGIK